MRVLIAGQPRTGTSALYFAKQRWATPDTWCLFEPEGLDTATLPDPALVKVLIAPLPGAPVLPLDPAPFDRWYILVRDPRDRLLSLLLFLPHWASTASPPWVQTAPTALAAWYMLLRAKVANPRGVPLRELFEGVMAARFGLRPSQALATLRAMQAAFMTLHAMRPNAETIRYEDMMAGTPSVPLIPPPRAYARVRRTGSSGEWRQWFLPSDVAYFRETMQPYLVHYGYDTTWNLPAHQTIDARGSLDYVTTWLRVQRWRSHARA